MTSSQHNLEFLLFWLEKEGATMYQISIYSITPYLLRWDIRCGGRLLRSGTATIQSAAEKAVNDLVHT